MASNMFRNLALVLALLLIVSVAESRTLATGFVKSTTPPSCDAVYGVQQGDTCFEVANNFNLSAESFGAINPNLNCDALFVGQWLCVAGSA